MTRENHSSIPTTESIKAMEFDSIDDLIATLEEWGIDSSTLSRRDNGINFINLPQTSLAYRDTKKGKIRFTQGAWDILSQIALKEFTPSAEKPLPTKLPTFNGFDGVWKLKEGGFFRPESATPDEELMDDERKGVLEKDEKGYWLKLKDESRLPMSGRAVNELEKTASGGIDTWIGKTIEVRVDDSKNPPLVIEIYFEGE
jgi:hypothetical protein